MFVFLPRSDTVRCPHCEVGYLYIVGISLEFYPPVDFVDASLLDWYVGQRNVTMTKCSDCNKCVTIVPTVKEVAMYDYELCNPYSDLPFMYNDQFDWSLNTYLTCSYFRMLVYYDYLLQLSATDIYATNPSVR